MKLLSSRGGGNNLVSDFNWNGFIIVIFGIIAIGFGKWYIILIVLKSLFYAVTLISFSYLF